MADVTISYARDNGATARQLAEAVERLGYDVWRPEDGSDAASAEAAADHIVAAKAAIVIWSGAASASEWIRAEANIARGLRKLVQASADGNPPPIPFDAAQVSSISTWLGDENHPGWEGIKAALAGLAGPPAALAPDAAAVGDEPSPIIPAPSIPEPLPVIPDEPAPEPGPMPEPEPIIPAPSIPEPLPVIPDEPAPEPEPIVPMPMASSESLSDPAPEPVAEVAEPVATAAPPPPPPSAALPPTRSKGPSGVLIVVILLVIVALLAAGAWFWQRSQPPETTSAETNMVAPPALETPPPAAQPSTEMPVAPANETFDRQAVLAGNDFAVVRSAPSQIAFSIARIEPGESFTTYQQSGEYWRVRTAAGTTGYLPAAGIRMSAPGEAPAATAAPTVPGKAAPARPDRRAEPRQPRGPRIRKENSEVMIAYCEGAGRGTPQCRRFGRSNY